MRRITFYVPGRSFLHSLHPSTKLTMYGLCMVLAYVSPWTIRWLFAASIFILLWVSGIPPWRYKVILTLTAISTFTVPLLYGLWPQPNDPITIYLWPGFGFRSQGLISGLTFAGLYFAIGMATIAWITTSLIYEMAEAPTMLGVHHVAGFALRYVLYYIPEVARHYLELADVWRTRGVVFNRGWVWQRFWLQCRLLAALLVLEFFRVKTKSNAVESRGFSLTKRGTYFILPPIPRQEKVLLLLLTAFTSLAATARIVTQIIK